MKPFTTVMIIAAALVVLFDYHFVTTSPAAILFNQFVEHGEVNMALLGVVISGYGFNYLVALFVIVTFARTAKQEPSK